MPHFGRQSCQAVPRSANERFDRVRWHFLRQFYRRISIGGLRAQLFRRVHMTCTGAGLLCAAVRRLTFRPLDEVFDEETCEVREQTLAAHWYMRLYSATGVGSGPGGVVSMAQLRAAARRCGRPRYKV